MVNNIIVPINIIILKFKQSIKMNLIKDKFILDIKNIFVFDGDINERKDNDYIL